MERVVRLFAERRGAFEADEREDRDRRAEREPRQVRAAQRELIRVD
jgi:hypothetical protein